MKAVILLLSVFFSCLCLSAQEWYHYAEEFYFVKEIPVKNLRGKKFRFEIAVKFHPSDTLSKPRIHGVGVGQGSNDFLKSDFSVESRVEQDWVIYTVAGKVQEDAWKLWFYAAVNGNGEFYFDDVDFYVELSKNQWKQLRLFNASFEEKGGDIFAGYFVSRRRSPTLSARLSREVYRSGTQSLMVLSKGQHRATDLSRAPR